jgi:hypothetical protein
MKDLSKMNRKELKEYLSTRSGAHTTSQLDEILIRILEFQEESENK